MARIVRDARLESRSARLALKVSAEPKWKAIDQGLAIGYRRGKTGGAWLMRQWVADKRGYAEERIGAADDRQDADGETVLSFSQAQERIRARVAELAEAAKVEALGPAVTVAQAVEEYCTGREARETKTRGSAGMRRDARSRLTKHVLTAPKKTKTGKTAQADGGDESLSALARKNLAALTSDDLSRWRRSLKMAPASARRTANDFKAALNAAARRYRDRLPERLRDTVKDGFAAETAEAPVAREAQILPDADIRALIAAAWKVDGEGDWGGDLGRIIVVLAATGARFSQVQRLTVADVQFTERRLIVPASRKGRATKPRKPLAVRVGDDVLDALRPATAGRKGYEPLLLRPRWRQVSPIKWEQFERSAWRSASELTRPWGETVAKAELPAETIPYALRHSSIVRGLRAGLPVRLVAALHDTSSAMIESHYAAHIVDALDEVTARAVIPLTAARPVVVSIEMNLKKA